MAKRNPAPKRRKYLSEIDERKLGAVLRAIYHPEEKRSALRDFVYFRSDAVSIASGDFYWGRRTTRAAVIFIGDASGHDAYAALLSALIGTKLNQLWSKYSKELDKHKVSKKAGEIVRELARDLASKFLPVMEQAVKNLDQPSKQNAGDDIKKLATDEIRAEGYVSAICVLTASSIDVISMGLPVFVVDKNRRVSICPRSRLKQFDDEKRVSLLLGTRRFPDPVRVDSRSRYLVIATDGIADEGGATHPKGEFGAARIKRVLERTPKGAELRQIVDGIFAAAKKHRGSRPVRDDRLVAVIDVKLWKNTLK